MEFSEHQGDVIYSLCARWRIAFWTDCMSRNWIPRSCRTAWCNKSTPQQFEASTANPQQVHNKSN